MKRPDKTYQTYKKQDLIDYIDHIEKIATNSAAIYSEEITELKKQIKNLSVDREKYANKKAAKSIKEFCEHVMHPDSDLHKDADEWIDNKLK